jgi:hypothetical protein
MARQQRAQGGGLTPRPQNRHSARALNQSIAAHWKISARLRRTQCAGHDNKPPRRGFAVCRSADLAPSSPAPSSDQIRTGPSDPGRFPQPRAFSPRFAPLLSSRRASDSRRQSIAPGRRRLRPRWRLRSRDLSRAKPEELDACLVVRPVSSLRILQFSYRITGPDEPA